LVEGDKVLVNVGGRAGAGIVAFSLADGKTVWKATDELASYSSPVATTVDGTRHAIFVTRYNVVSLDPSNGAVRFAFPFGKRGPTVNAAAPLVTDDRLFVTASYGVGAVAVRVGRSSVEDLWKGDDILSSQYSTAIHHDGHFYGIDGRADVGTTQLRCVEAKSGKVAWSKADFGVANLIFADGKLVVVKDDGTLVLARVTPKECRELAKAAVLEGVTRALPALSAGKLFVRDTATLKCLVLHGPAG
jgi:outer membrane protein assembly factor BamB